MEKAEWMMNGTGQGQLVLVLKGLRSTAPKEAVYEITEILKSRPKKRGSKVFL